MVSWFKDTISKVIPLNLFIEETKEEQIPDKWWVKFNSWNGWKHQIFHNAQTKFQFKTLELVHLEGKPVIIKILDDNQMKKWWDNIQKIRSNNVDQGKYTIVCMCFS